MGLNKVMLLGTVSASAKVETFGRSQKVATVFLSLPDRKYDHSLGDYADSEQTIEVQFFNGKNNARADEAASLSNGTVIFVDGKIRVDSWLTKDTREQRTRTKIIGDSYQVISGGSGSTSAPIGATNMDADPPF